jgi:hypothetical protein
MDPPPFVVRPWNSYTYESNANVVDSATAQFTSIDIIGARIRANMGMSSTSVIELKILRAYVWATSDGPDFLQPGIDVFFMEMTGQSFQVASPSVRSQVKDLGTVNRPAHVGYEWPIVDSREVFREQQENNPIVLRVSVSSAPIRLTQRVHVLWRIEAA